MLVNFFSSIIKFVMYQGIYIICSLFIGIMLYHLRNIITSLIVKPISKNLTETEKDTVTKTTRFFVVLGIIAITICLLFLSFGDFISTALVLPFITIVTEKALGVAIILVVGCILYGLRRTLVRKLLTYLTKANENKKATLEQVLVKVLGIAIVGLCIIQLLLLFGADATTILAFTGAISVAFGLAAKDLVNDFLSGSIFIVEDQFHLGDVITANGITGQVTNINLRTLILRSADGNTHIVPNGTITVVTNHTREFSKATVVVGVSYKSDIDFVLSVLKDEMATALSEIDEITEVPEVHGIVEFDSSAVMIRVVATCVPGGHWSTERELRRRIKLRFDKENIEIPFKQHVVTINKEQ
ncbi:MAG: mechanosensitive ion channel family protein [Lachnospirales bacterium]